MITAKEALQLYEESSAEVEHFLTTRVDPQIRKAAKNGKKEVIIHIGNRGPYEYIEHLITHTHTIVLTRLKQLGFTAHIKQYGESYVPIGLADVEGKGPTHTNYGIHVSW